MSIRNIGTEELLLIQACVEYRQLLDEAVTKIVELEKQLKETKPSKYSDLVSDGKLDPRN